MSMKQKNGENIAGRVSGTGVEIDKCSTVPIVGFHWYEVGDFQFKWNFHDRSSLHRGDKKQLFACPLDILSKSDIPEISTFLQVEHRSPRNMDMFCFTCKSDLSSRD